MPPLYKYGTGPLDKTIFFTILTYFKIWKKSVDPIFHTRTYQFV